MRIRLRFGLGKQLRRRLRADGERKQHTTHDQNESAHIFIKLLFDPKYKEKINRQQKGSRSVYQYQSQGGKQTQI